MGIENALHPTASHVESSDAAGFESRLWITLQATLLCAGVVLAGLLLLKPALGLNLLWNALIPVAPALLVIAPGLWRNVCPMATWSLLPRQWGVSEARVPTRRAASLLRFGGLAALLLIVPVRHLCLNTDGALSALLLITAATAAFALGLKYEGRSGWCASACPIHPVEKLYGNSPAVRFTNARCNDCVRCSAPCPDSTRSMTPAVTAPSDFESAMGHVLIGGFAGFVFGWFQIPDYHGDADASAAVAAFLLPFGGGLLSLALYGALRRWVAVTPTARRRLVRLFAAAAVSSYYGFRLPALVGFGPHHGTGMVADLTAVLPAWAPLLSAAATTAFFFWFMVIREESGMSWTVRPPLQARQPSQ